MGVNAGKAQRRFYPRGRGDAESHASREPWGALRQTPDACYPPARKPTLGETHV